jgi:murein DD-endopeptidase MepM/ murein hydrolase activator NlpD
MSEPGANARKNWVARAQSLLPVWHVELRTDGRRHEVRIGTRTQAMALSVAVLAAGFVGLGVADLASNAEQEDAAERVRMARMSAEVAALKADTVALRGQVLTTAERIEARQKFLDALITGKARGKELAELLPPGGRARLSGAAAQEAGVLAPFAALEANQLALVDKAAATAETRLRDAQALLRRLGLEQSRFVAQSALRTGLGGPLVPAMAGQSGDNAGPDPRFADLFVSWQKVAQLEEAMVAIPAFTPAENFTYTSAYGFRWDPFTGGGAMHAGIDLAGAHGEPIRASASGRVVRAERFGSYGLAVDIDHGRGILTRYAHLSRIHVAVGDRVEAGERIGAMGSTGRSTGTHLHYEVRIDGRPVNPRPFLDSARYILAMQQSGEAGPR